VIRILLVDDHDMMRSGLKLMIQADPQMRVIAEATTGRTAVDLAHELKPDVVVMDLRMPDLGGIDATRQIVASDPGIKVIALTAHADGQTATAAMAAGASGYVIKDAAFEELSNAIQSAMENKVFLSPRVRDAIGQP